MMGPCSKLGAEWNKPGKEIMRLFRRLKLEDEIEEIPRLLLQLEGTGFVLFLEKIVDIKRRSVFRDTLSLFLFIGTPRTQLPSEPAYTVVCTSIYRT